MSSPDRRGAYMIDQKPRYRRLVAIVLSCVALTTLTNAASQAGPGVAGTPQEQTAYRRAFLERCRQVTTAMGRQVWRPGDDSRRRIYLGVLKVATGTDAETGLQYLRDAVSEPTPAWGSFETYAFMDAVLRLGPALPSDLVLAIRDRLARSFTRDVGFTDNHRLQYFTARYLFAQRWPDGPIFADGLSPAAARAEALARMQEWITFTAKHGLYEYDSPNYHHLYLLCLATLHEFAGDESLRQRAWMMNQVLLAQWASEYLEGVWVGAHSREKFNQVLHTRDHPGAGAPFGPLFFGAAKVDVEQPEAFYISLGALQAFDALPIVERIATDRRHPYVQRSLKPPRRGPGIANGAPIWKYDYVTSAFALGSSWGDLTDVENHRWDLTWRSEKDGATCFFINPSYSERQLVRFYDSTPDRILGEILRQRPYYADPDKWIEGSPFEDVFQHENVVIALYDMPSDAARQHVNGFFPRIIEERRQVGPWILCRADGVYFAVWTSSPGSWHDDGTHDRLRIEAPRLAVVMEAVASRECPSFDAFCQRVTARAPGFDSATLTARMTSLAGRQLQFTFYGERVVDGKAQALSAWPLFDGPWMDGRVGSGIITLSHDRERVEFDFTTGYHTQPLSGGERIRRR